MNLSRGKQGFFQGTITAKNGVRVKIKSFFGGVTPLAQVTEVGPSGGTLEANVAGDSNLDVGSTVNFIVDENNTVQIIESPVTAATSVEILPKFKDFTLAEGSDGWYFTLDGLNFGYLSPLEYNYYPGFFTKSVSVSILSTGKIIYYSMSFQEDGVNLVDDEGEELNEGNSTTLVRTGTVAATLSAEPCDNNWAISDQITDEDYPKVRNQPYGTEDFYGLVSMPTLDVVTDGVSITGIHVEETVENPIPGSWWAGVNKLFGTDETNSVSYPFGPQSSVYLNSNEFRSIGINGTGTYYGHMPFDGTQYYFLSDVWRMRLYDPLYVQSRGLGPFWATHGDINVNAPRSISFGVTAWRRYVSSAYPYTPGEWSECTDGIQRITLTNPGNKLWYVTWGKSVTFNFPGKPPFPLYIKNASEGFNQVTPYTHYSAFCNYNDVDRPIVLLLMLTASASGDQCSWCSNNQFRINIHPPFVLSYDTQSYSFSDYSTSVDERKSISLSQRKIVKMYNVGPIWDNTTALESYTDPEEVSTGYSASERDYGTAVKVIKTINNFPRYEFDHYVPIAAPYNGLLSSDLFTKTSYSFDPGYNLRRRAEYRGFWSDFPFFGDGETYAEPQPINLISSGNTVTNATNCASDFLAFPSVVVSDPTFDGEPVWTFKPFNQWSGSDYGYLYLFNSNTSGYRDLVDGIYSTFGHLYAMEVNEFENTIIVRELERDGAYTAIGEFTRQDASDSNWSIHNFFVPGETYNSFINPQTNSYVNISNGSVERFVESYWSDKNGFIPQTFRGEVLTADKKGLHFTCDYAEVTSGNLINFGGGQISADYYSYPFPSDGGITIEGHGVYREYEFDPTKRYFFKISSSSDRWVEITFIYKDESDEITTDSWSGYVSKTPYSTAAVSDVNLFGIHLSGGTFLFNTAFLTTTSGYSRKSFIMKRGVGQIPFQHKVGNIPKAFVRRWHNNEQKAITRDVFR